MGNCRYTRIQGSSLVPGCSRTCTGLIQWSSTHLLFFKCSPDSLSVQDSDHDNRPFPKKLLDSGSSDDVVNSAS